MIKYQYNTAGSLDDLLSRVEKIRNGSSSNRVEYDRNGLGRITLVKLWVDNVHLSYQNDNDGDYEGFDRFGRTESQQWRKYGAGAADRDRFYYDHDRVGNPEYRDIPSSIYATDDKDQAFTYDGLHRLATFDTGTLVGSTITGTPGSEQDFTLDQLGNWTGFVEKASGSTTLNQSRTGNDANEITNITESTGPSWVTPVYDDNGNMTQGPRPGGETTNHKFIYDAWNRLVEVTDDSDVTIARYEYDGFNRRIVKDDELADPDVDYDYFYNESWQIVEVRKDDDTDPLIEMVYHEHYIDAPAYRYYDANTDGTADEQYFSFDANFNVTALYDDSATVLERYEYDSYGQVTILDADFSDDADNTSDYEQHHLFAGYRLDTESDLYEVRNRFLHPALGRWMQRDPLGYVDGMSLYQYVKNQPMTSTDPQGLLSNRPARGWFGRRICQSAYFVDRQKCYLVFGRLRTACLERANFAYQACNALFDASGDAALILPCITPPPMVVAGLAFCTWYPPCWSHYGINFRCMCLCMGNSLWSMCARGCIQCSIAAGAHPFNAHAACWVACTGLYGFPPTILSYCGTLCKCAQLGLCGGGLENY